MDPLPPPYPPGYQPLHPYPPPTTTVSVAPIITPAVTEALTNTAATHVAANPTPPPNPTSNHPPYAEMIYAAITALKERDGSSKRAIAKYIERAYSGLPTTHSALLTHHLKRLKNSGHLVMVKKSYRLPRSDDASASASLPPPLPPPASAPPAATTTTATPALPSAGPPRGRGRPPKPKPIPDQPTLSQPSPIPLPQQQPTFHIQQQPIPIPQQQPTFQHQPIPQQPNVQQSILQQPNLQQPINFQHFPDPTIQPNSQPMLVALGLVDEPVSVKKRPGRPRKVVSAGVGVGNGQAALSVSAKRGRGRPPGSRLAKKRPGRPPKPKSVSAVSGPNGLVKRGRGRPSKAEPKSVFFPYATNVPLVGAFEQNNVPNNVVATQPPARRRGRPKKDAAATSSAIVAVSGGLVSGKRRGRPPRVPGIERPKRSSTGRPVGRPKKNALVPTTEAPDPKSVANGEFKRKLEYFQFRVGKAVGALKPYLNHEGAVIAIAAIQELEGLAAMDISAPLNIEAPQPPLTQS